MEGQMDLPKKDTEGVRCPGAAHNQGLDLSTQEFSLGLPTPKGAIGRLWGGYEYQVHRAEPPNVIAVGVLDAL